MAKITNMESIAPVAEDQTLVLQELKRMQAQLTDLKKENEEIKKAARVGTSAEQVKYDGVRFYSVKTWNDKIVCDYVSKKKEANKDFVFKNQYGEWIDNQVMTLIYADGSKEDVMYTQFGMGYQKSEKIYTPKSVNKNSD